jgi:N-acyl-D-aspartate/D-glutamate deacylase
MEFDMSPRFRFWALALLALLWLRPFDLATAQTPGPFDILITNGRIIDGAGNPWYHADIAITGDRIAAMGRLADATAKRTIDAGGQAVTPGFIDLHNHGRRGIFKVPTAENYIRQGVTTLIEGNDGGSPLPLAPFFEKLEATGIAVNMGLFVGHGSIRQEIIGRADRPATPDELDQMRRLTRQAMEQGWCSRPIRIGRGSGWARFQSRSSWPAGPVEYGTSLEYCAPAYFPTP